MEPAPATAPRQGRAAPLPPDERRRAILSAVAPVLLERGTSATTKELAEAAGVAEGTLFRVFPDKASLLRETVLAAIDPAVAVPQIEAIDRFAPVREKLLALVDIALARVGETMRWFALLHEVGRNTPEQAAAEAQRGRAEWMRRQESGNAQVHQAVAALLAPDARAFRLPVAHVVELFDVVVVGASVRARDASLRPDAARPVLPPATLVDMLLRGVVSGAPPPGVAELSGLTELLSETPDSHRRTP